MDLAPIALVVSIVNGGVGVIVALLEFETGFAGNGSGLSSPALPR